MTNYYSDQMALSKIYGWHLYVVSVPGFVKIGTASRVWIRLSSLQTGNPHKLKIEAVWHFKCRNEARSVEKAALSVSALNRLPQSEWCQSDVVPVLTAIRDEITRLGARAKLLPDGAEA